MYTPRRKRDYTETHFVKKYQHCSELYSTNPDIII